MIDSIILTVWQISQLIVEVSHLNSCIEFCVKKLDNLILTGKHADFTVRNDFTYSFLINNFGTLSQAVLWRRSILAWLRLQLVKLAAPAPAPAPAQALALLSTICCWKKKFCKICLLNLPGLVLFKEKYECFALLFQYQYFIERDRLVLFYIFVKIFVYFFSLNIRSELELEL